MEARAHGAYRRADRPSNLLHGEIAVVAKDHRDALVGIERAERALEGVSLVDLAIGVMWGSRRSCSIQIGVASVAATPEAIPADIDQDSAEPGLEALRIPEPAMIPPGADERVVCCIFCLLSVAEDEASEAIGRIEAVLDQPLEGGRASRIGVRGDDPFTVAQPVLLCSYRRLSAPKHSERGLSLVRLAVGDGAYPGRITSRTWRACSTRGMRSG